MRWPLWIKPAVLLLALAVRCGISAAAELWVTQAGDAGRGSLRQAISEANRLPGKDRIRFDAANGVFGGPRTIQLQSPLPVITDSLEIDGYIPDRLWSPSGVTIDGMHKFRVFEVAPHVSAELRYLSVANGAATIGAGLLSDGDTIIEGMMFCHNAADAGGGVAQRGGTLKAINSTFWRNRADRFGGGIALLAGETRIVHCTAAGNGAPVGAGLHNSAARLTMVNSILANSLDGADCHSLVELAADSTHNLVEQGEGCGTALLAVDPRLGEPGLYNGPTPTVPLEGGSPAINWADNSVSLDADGNPLQWDQRGNGDPRFAAGIADIGAFEEQAVTLLEIDVPDDVDLRGCSGLPADCSLRGALAIANASPRHAGITVSARIFRDHPIIRLAGALPRITQDLSISAPDGVNLQIVGRPGDLSRADGVTVELKGITWVTNEP